MNLLNLYSLIFALFSKIEGMSEELDNLKPILNVNASVIPDDTLNISETLAINIPTTCTEIVVPCAPHRIFVFSIPATEDLEESALMSTVPSTYFTSQTVAIKPEKLMSATSELTNQLLTATNLIENQNTYLTNKGESETIMRKPTVTQSSIDLLVQEQWSKIRQLSSQNTTVQDENDTSTEYYEEEYPAYDSVYNDTAQTNDDLQYEVTEKSNIDDDNYFDGYRDYSKNVTMYPDDLNVTDILNTSDVSSLQTSSIDEYFMEVFNVSITDSYKFNDSEYVSTPRYNESTDLEFQTTFVEKVTARVKDSSNEMSTSDSPVDLYTLETYASSDWFETTQKPIVTEFDATSSNFDTTLNSFASCPRISFNVTVNCGGTNITQVFTIYNCTMIEKQCYTMKCRLESTHNLTMLTQTNATDVAYIDEYNREMYNLTKETKKKLLKLCWETMFGQELVKLTMMDLVRKCEYVTYIYLAMHEVN